MSSWLWVAYCTVRSVSSELFCTEAGGKENYEKAIGECTLFFFFEAFPGWPHLWKELNVTNSNTARDAKMPRFPSWIHTRDLCTVLVFLPSSPPPFFYLIFSQISPRCFILCWLGLDKLNFWDRSKMELLHGGKHICMNGGITKDVLSAGSESPRAGKA